MPVAFAMAALGLALNHASSFTPRCASVHAPLDVPRCSTLFMEEAAPAEKNVPIPHTNPLPVLTPREVIDSVMAALHRSNWETPTPFYGFEVALRFFAPTHQAKLSNAKPAGFARFMQRPHKKKQILWNEYRFDGEVVLLTSDAGVREAYQAVSLREKPTDEWQQTRWKLVQVEFDYGSTVMPPTWQVEHVFVNEPDTWEDIEYLKSKAPPEQKVLDWNGEIVPLESAREVVMNTMKALRRMDEPYPLHGAVVATRYCSPNNRASELSPQVFASYLKEPFYAVLAEWDEMDFDEEDEEDEEDDDFDPTKREYEVLIKREEDESFAIVTWSLSSYEGQWLIDSMNVTP